MPIFNGQRNAGVRSLRWKFVAWWFGAFLALGGFAPTFAQDDATALIIELLSDKDKEIRALAFEQIRTEAKGEAATVKFAGLLPTQSPEIQVGLLSALSARGDKAAAPAVRSLLAQTSPESVKIAAIDALGLLGADQDVALLIPLLFSKVQAEQAAARLSLERLSGDATSSAIAKEMQSASAAQRLLLIDVLKNRRGGAPALLEAAVDADPAVRTAAMSALGEVGAPEHVAGMVKGIFKAQPGAERIAAERAVALVSQRGADPSQKSAPLLAAMKSMPAAEKIILLPTLGRIGGTASLEVVEKAFSDSDPKMRAAGLMALCNWPDGSIASRLSELAKTEKNLEHRKLARRALIRVAPLPDGRSDQQRLELLQSVFAMCESDSERNLVLQRASGIRAIETLRFVTPFLAKPPFAQQACESIVELAHHRGLREPNKAEFDRALDQVIKLSKDEVVIDRARRYKEGQTWVRPKPARSS